MTDTQSIVTVVAFLAIVAIAAASQNASYGRAQLLDLLAALISAMFGMWLLGVETGIAIFAFALGAAELVIVGLRAVVRHAPSHTRAE